MEQRLSLITLGVEDLERSRRFYERLGWRPAGVKAAEVVFFQLGGIALGLYGRNDLARDIGIEPEPRGFAGITLAHNGRSKAEVDAVLAEVVAAGGQVVKPAHDIFWGGYVGYFTDPDGHYWEVAWNPFFPIADDGSIKLPD